MQTGKLCKFNEGTNGSMILLHFYTKCLSSDKKSHWNYGIVFWIDERFRYGFQVRIIIKATRLIDLMISNDHEYNENN